MYQIILSIEIGAFNYRGRRERKREWNKWWSISKCTKLLSTSRTKIGLLIPWLSPTDHIHSTVLSLSLYFSLRICPFTSASALPNATFTGH